MDCQGAWKPYPPPETAVGEGGNGAKEIRKERHGVACRSLPSPYISSFNLRSAVKTP